MMDKIKIRKILALVFLILGVLLFVAASIDLIKEWLSLPSTYTMQNEGKFVAWGIEKILYFFTIPVVISLLLGAYLLYPSKFEKFSKVAKIIFSLLVIVGFGVSIGLGIISIINNFQQPNFLEEFLTIKVIFQMTLTTSPFWTMGIIALFSFKKDKFEEMNDGYKVGLVGTLGFVVLLAAYILFFTIRCFRF